MCLQLRGPHTDVGEKSANSTISAAFAERAHGAEGRRQDLCSHAVHSVLIELNSQWGSSHVGFCAARLLWKRWIEFETQHIKAPVHKQQPPPTCFQAAAALPKPWFYNRGVAWRKHQTSQLKTAAVLPFQTDLLVAVTCKMIIYISFCLVVPNHSERAMTNGGTLFNTRPADH